MTTKEELLELLQDADIKRAIIAIVTGDLSKEGELPREREGGLEGERRRQAEATGGLG